MPGIGMGDKYSWTEPPTFNTSPGDYDYMPNATSYEPISLKSVENAMNDILSDLNTEISNCSISFFNSEELTNLYINWNNLFIINGEQQILLNDNQMEAIGEEIEAGFNEIEATIDSYFDDAEAAINNIKASLKVLEDNANKVNNANKNKDSEDITLRESAISFLQCVEKFGKQYTESNLSSIGKWVY